MPVTELIRHIRNRQRLEKPARNKISPAQLACIAWPNSQCINQTVLPLPTTLIFRDGKTELVQNYAIVGGTLWAFNQQRARKIPVSELNIPATRKVNEDHGVEFSIPQ